MGSNGNKRKSAQKGTSKGLFDSVKTKLTMIIVLIMAVPLILTIIISYATSHAEYFNLSGQRQQCLQHGLNIVRQPMSDGTLKLIKLVKQ